MSDEGRSHSVREGWVQVTSARGPMETGLIVEYLRAEGIKAIAWPEGGGEALGFTDGPLAASKILVPEDSFQEALALLEEEESLADEMEDEEEGDRGSRSDLTKAVLGATALAVNPLGTGIALGLTYFMGSDLDEESEGVVDCIACGIALELNREETEQGWFTCPECGTPQPLALLARCPNCQSELELDEAEKKASRYQCPECGQEVQLQPGESDHTETVS